LRLGGGFDPKGMRIRWFRGYGVMPERASVSQKKKLNGELGRRDPAAEGKPEGTNGGCCATSFAAKKKDCALVIRIEKEIH